MQSAYAAFDLFPSSKGAATHINHASRILFDFIGEGTLFCLGDDKLPKYQMVDNIEVQRFSDPIKHYLDRGQAYSEFIANRVSGVEGLEVVHYRDIWSAEGFKNTNAKHVFEVNGFTSIELPYHYPNMLKSTLQKLAVKEDELMKAADVIITPSHVTKRRIEERVGHDNIHVVPNSGSLDPKYAPVDGLPEKYFVYFGAVQAWQGVATVIRAMGQVNQDYKLVICCSTSENKMKYLKKLARRRDVFDRIVWFHQLDKPSLNTVIQGAVASLAPLSDCARNVMQGCSPIKVFESIATKTPVIVSDLGVTREIVNEDQALFVRADRPDEWGYAMNWAIENVETMQNNASRAHSILVDCYNLANIKQLQTKAYQSIGL